MTGVRIQAALYMCIADIFFGAGALILVMIMISQPVVEERVARTVDIEARCQQDADSAWQVARFDPTATAEADLVWQDIDSFVSKTAETGLMHRVGLHLAEDQMDCFKALSWKISRHNSALTGREQEPAASLTLIFIPKAPEEAAQQ